MTPVQSFLVKVSLLQLELFFVCNTEETFGVAGQAKVVHSTLMDP